MVVWLIGISGSGKTTLGNKIEYYFNQKLINCVLLDGDEIREFFDNDLGYSVEERRANIMRILLAAYFLEKKKIIPIICNISPFEDIRSLAKKKLDNYIQIYLKKDVQTAIKNDVKNIYSENISKTEIVGVNIIFEDPKESKLILNTDKESIDESLDKIFNMLKNEIKY